MRVKSFLCLCLMGLLLSGSGRAEALPLPDLSVRLGISGEKQQTDYQFSADYSCDVWVYALPQQAETVVGLWLLDCVEAGFSVRKTEVEGISAYQVTDAVGQYALLFPKYQGAVMLLMQSGMSWEAPAPSVRSSAGGSAPKYQWVEAEQDCPACVGGVCSLCKGTGWYRLYGEKVLCALQCQVCDGRGTYTIQKYLPATD